MDEAKPFKIPKREIWEAFKSVKANQGAAGVDGQSIAAFEANLSGNLYKLWNRMSSGSYFPPPLSREYEALWSPSCDSTWSLTSARAACTGGAEKCGSPARKTFFDNIVHLRPSCTIAGDDRLFPDSCHAGWRCQIASAVPLKSSARSTLMSTPKPFFSASLFFSGSMSRFQISSYIGPDL